jgi:hypothetical protein
VAASKGQATHFKADFVGNDIRDGKPIFYGERSESTLLSLWGCCSAERYNSMVCKLSTIACSVNTCSKEQSQSCCLRHSVSLFCVEQANVLYQTS